MKRFIGWMLAACLLLALAVPAALADEGTVMYVKTSKGGGIYVRSSMSAVDNSNVVGSLPYGSRVVTYGGNFNGWTMIDYADGGDYYVMYRYLVPDPPEPYVNPTQDDKNFSTKEAATIGQMNTLVANARYVTPYTITVNPTRASGWVYVRWFPSRNAKELATLGANSQLTVLAELKDWYQVSDPNTGKIGFIYKSYVQH